MNASSGLIDFAMDVQVNSGAFCQFLGVRGGPSVPVWVNLHDLTYTPGVPFRMVLTVDVDAGTFSATQDGNTVAVSSTSFPHLPFRFAMEGCTTNAQSSSIDNLTISTR